MTATKRQAAMSIDNMSKLVDDPVDARPLIPLLMPALEYATETLCDPEARGCVGACYCWYASALDAKVKSVAINDIDHEAVFGFLKAKVPSAVVAAGEIALCHVAHLICSCMATKKFTAEDWADVIGQLSNLIPAEGPIQKVSFRWVMFRG